MLAVLLAHILVLPRIAKAAPTPIREASAHIVISRAFATGQGADLKIAYETVCEKDLLVPVYDFRPDPADGGQAEPAELRCPSIYRDRPVPILVHGVLQLVSADGLGLGLPAGTAVKRTFFTITPEVGGDFPYLSEIQETSAWQLFTEDLNLRSQLFRLSPEAFLEIDCSSGTCAIKGPQSLYRAQVSLLDPAP